VYLRFGNTRKGAKDAKFKKRIGFLGVLRYRPRYLCGESRVLAYILINPWQSHLIPDFGLFPDSPVGYPTWRTDREAPAHYFKNHQSEGLSRNEKRVANYAPYGLAAPIQQKQKRFANFMLKVTE
jgi:hypothetical protein